MMNAVFALVVAWLFAHPAQAGDAARAAASCQFAILHAVPPIVATGPGEFLSRLRVIRQPDSPVAITAIDFTGGTLTASPGNYVHTGGYVVEILNVSDRVVSNANVMVMVRIGQRSGSGAGVKFKGPIKPGERAVYDLRRAGPASGNGPSTAEPTVDVFVKEVEVAGCVYMPSQAIPPTL